MSRTRQHRWADDTRARHLGFGLAADTATLDAAFRLVHDQYVWRGFMTPHPSGRRVNIRHALPSTRVFVAHDGARVLGTVTVIPDSPLGLPMQEVFSDELNAFRRRGRRIAEASALAMDADRRGHGLPVLMPLLRLAVLYAAEVAELDDLCLVVRPQHAEFYRQYFAGRVIGGPRDYVKVNLPGAVALHIDLHEVRALIRGIQAGHVLPDPLHDFLYGFAARAAVVQLRRDAPGAALTASQFARFFLGQDVLAEAPRWQRSYVEAFYAHEAAVERRAA